MKFPLWATVFTILGFLVLISLGYWQIQRLNWKMNILAILDQEYKRDASQHPLYNLEEEAPSNFSRGYVEGTYDYQKAIFIGPRTNEGRSGYHLLVPLELRGGGHIPIRYILINRGWVGSDDSVYDQLKGSVRVTGMLRFPEKPNIFVPENHPDHGEWFRYNLPQMRNYFGYNHLLPFVLYAEGESYSEGGDYTRTYPLRATYRIRPSNNHLHYAIFWFTMSVLLLLFYYLRFFRAQMSGSS